MTEHKQDCPWYADFSQCDCHVFVLHNLEYEVSCYVNLLKQTKEKFYTIACQKGGDYYQLMTHIDDTLKKFNK
jgi:hypothetical protein